jgi:hypothetical protein
MTIPPSSIPLSVDYTNRDFYSLRQALIDRVKFRIASSNTLEWNGDDPADFGVALVEAFAYMGDVMSYYIDRVANESYLATATQRENILSIARSYGYLPSGYTSASVSVSITNTTGSSVTVPSGSQLVGNIVVNDATIEVIFTTDQELVIASGAEEVVTASHGELIGKRTANLAVDSSDVDGEVLGISDGFPEQSFTLSETSVVEDTITVYVQNGDTYDAWNRVLHISDYGPTDAVYQVVVGADNVQTVVFGDGISGAIPANYAIIKADYVVGGGTIGNIPANILDTLQYAPGLTVEQTTALNNAITIVNDNAASGGSDPESNASIRESAPFALTALNRAVTLADYQTLAESADNVGKAKAVANNRNSVTVYVAPERTEGSAEDYPGMADDLVTPRPEWLTIQENVEDYLSDKTQIGVTVTVAPPTYVPVSVSFQYIKLPEYSTTDIETSLKLALLNSYSYNNNLFGGAIRPEQIEALLVQVPGVTSVKVISLYRTGSTAARNVLVGASSEVFVFRQANVTVAAASTVSTLSALTVSAGTLSPTFSGSFFNYNLPVPNGTTAVTFAPTVTNAAATAYVDGTVYTGSAISVATPVGTKVVPILVYAGDSVTSQTYYVSVVRTS